jgi:hypothetical protein
MGQLLLQDLITQGGRENIAAYSPHAGAVEAIEKPRKQAKIELCLRKNECLLLVARQQPVQQLIRVATAATQ